MIFGELMEWSWYSSVEETANTFEGRGIHLAMNRELEMRELLVNGGEVAWNLKREVSSISSTEFLVYFSTRLLSGVKSQ